MLAVYVEINKPGTDSLNVAAGRLISPEQVTD
jgi:hypothetical protein